jgi:hypothetical protein
MAARVPAPPPGNLLHRRPRMSTVVLLAIFGGLLALYVLVRPDTVTGDGRPVPSPTPSVTVSGTP